MWYRAKRDDLINALCASHSFSIIDFSYDDMTGEKWKATELIKMVRHYQPDVIIDNRLEGAGDNHGSIATDNPLIYSGDFASPEQIIPPKGVCDINGEPIPWELCATMNNHWGYCNFDHQYKTPEMLVRKLCRVC